MISVTVTKEKGEFRRLYLLGHAGYADTDDVVCAAVSALVLNTINAIETFTEDHFSIGEDPGRGMIDFQFEDTVSHDSHLLMETMILGIQKIIDSYGETYVSFNTQEV